MCTNYTDTVFIQCTVAGRKRSYHICTHTADKSGAPVVSARIQTFSRPFTRNINFLQT